MASGEDLILKISADTADVARGLAPMEKALDDLADSAKDLDDTQITMDVKEEALTKARRRIDELRDTIARDVVLGVSTKGAEKEIRELQSAVRKLTDEPATVDVDVDVDTQNLASAVEGIDSLREGALQLGDAVGNLDGTFASWGGVMRETVPAMADLNQTMVAMQLRNQAVGKSFGVLGRSVSAATSLMAGPWGLAIAAGVGLLAAWTARQEDAAESTMDLTDAIDAQAGALDASNRAAIAKLVTDDELLLKSERFGFSLEDMTSAILGNASAMAKMDAAYAKAKEQHPDNIVAIQNTMLAYNLLRLEVDRTRNVQGGVQRAIGQTGRALGDNATQLDAQLSLWDLYEDAVSSAQKELDDIVSSLDILNGRFADSREATANYEESLDNLTDAIKNGTRDMRLNTTEGRANDALVREHAKRIEEMTKARLRDMETSGESSKKILADYKSQREQLIVMADKLGLSGKAAQEYVNKLLATPKKVTTEVEQEGAEEAAREIDKAAKDRDTAINVDVRVNVDKVSQDIARGVRNGLSGVGPIGPNVSSVAPTPSPRGTSTVFLQPRLYLDSAPIRAALRGDVDAAVSSSVATTRQRGRL